MAADGAWDGKVWQHGAVGWRMSLPGWRGAYMGDFLGMQDRQRIHFAAYAKSQVTDVPVTEPHLMDEKNNLARGTYNGVLLCIVTAISAEIRRRTTSFIITT